MDLKKLGNIYSSDGEFTTRAAILQSIYRGSINEECGTGKKNVIVGTDENGKPILKSVEQEYGHLVSGGEYINKNFFFKETFDYAHYRVKNRKKDETIKADRLFNNLLSSMPMAFNLFHPLMMIRKKYPDALNRMIRNAFPSFPVHAVEDILIEYIPLPISTYTGDRSAMDAAIVFSDDSGKRYIIAIETKYIDKLGQNAAQKTELQIQSAMSLGCFNQKGMDLIQKGCTQIYRNFLLTEKFRIVNNLADSYSIIMAPEHHPTTEKEIKCFHENLLPQFHYKLSKYSLEDFFAALKPDCPDEFTGWLNWFYNRYLDFSKTEDLYRQFINK